MDIGKAIFITNVFAQSQPELHVKRWEQFEKDVSLVNRSGYYGADNVAYVRWLKENYQSEIKKLMDQDLDARSL